MGRVIPLWLAPAATASAQMRTVQVATAKVIGTIRSLRGVGFARAVVAPARRGHGKLARTERVLVSVPAHRPCHISARPARPPSLGNP